MEQLIIMLPEIGGIPEDVWQISEKTHDADQMLLYKDLIILVKELPTNYRIVFNMAKTTFKA